MKTITTTSSESNLRKKRVCKHCGDTLYVTARALSEHASTCRRMKALGLEAVKLIVDGRTK